jgi:hypothetical protein
MNKSRYRRRVHRVYVSAMVLRWRHVQRVTRSSRLLTSVGSEALKDAQGYELLSVYCLWSASVRDTIKVQTPHLSLPLSDKKDIY